MATKAQAFKAQKMVDGHGAKPKAKAAVSEEPKISRNQTKRVDTRGGPALEEVGDAKPSRKSTRASSGHVKRTTNLQAKAVRKASAPSTRAAKAKATAKKR